MLQRIQTIFLLASTICMLLASITPLAGFLYDGGLINFEAMGIYKNGVLHETTWGLFAIGAASSLVALITIFLFKNRLLQIRLIIANIVLMVGFYLFFAFLVYRLDPVNKLQFQQMGVGIILPLVAIIFSILAIRKIGADEVMVRSLDRLRK